MLIGDFSGVLWHVWRLHLLAFNFIEVDTLEEPVVLDVLYSIFQVSVPFCEVVLRQVGDDALGVRVELFGKRDGLSEN